MKKRVLVFLLGLVFVMFLSSFVVAVDGIYVVRNFRNVDSGFVDAFSSKGLSVDIIEDRYLDGINFSKYDFIFVGDDRLRHVEEIPVDEVPLIIANRYYGKYFGLTNGGISKLSSSAPLRVVNWGDLINVYDRSVFRFRRFNIPYYYIPGRYGVAGMDSVATTYRGYKKELGDVIAYSNSGVEKCFFGIVESEYWTAGAKELFNECIDFVVGGGVVVEPVVVPLVVVPVVVPVVNESNVSVPVVEPVVEPVVDGNISEGGVHDVGVSLDYSNAVNGIRIRDIESGEYLLEDVSLMDCNKKYKIDFKSVNVGNFSENVLINLSFGDLEWGKMKEGLEVGKSTTTGSKTVNVSFASGLYDIVVNAFVEGDVSLGDNIRSRAVEVVC